MSRSTRALIQIGVALMLAIAAGVLIFMWTANLTTQPATTTTVAAKTVNVVVANIDIHRGTKLTEDMLEVKQFTLDSRPGGSFPEIEELAGRVLSTDVGTNEAITNSKLADPSVIGGGVSALIEPGMRAMAVKGNMVMGLSGFVRPGDRVDVIVTLTEGRDGNPVTKLVLEKIKILATGTELTPPDKDGQTASVDVYTLEVTPKESERLALASNQGTLNFALRNEQDDKKILTTGVTVPRALAALRPKPKPRPRRRAPVKVEIITGGDTHTLKF